MIVSTMPNLTIYNELSSDKEKLKIKAMSMQDKVIAKFRKARHFPVWEGVEYVHQTSRNKYLISFYAGNAQQAEKPDIQYLGIIVDDEGNKIIAHWGCWPMHVHDDGCDIATRFIGYYSPHFFSRYRERVLKGNECSFYELVGQYFSRNQVNTPIKLNSDIQRRFMEYGKFADYAFKVKDGICFIKSWAEGDYKTIKIRDNNYISVVEYHTIVPESMMTETQTTAIEKESMDFLKSLFERYL